MKPFDIDQIRLQAANAPPQNEADAAPLSVSRAEPFLKGPIPWDWIARASELPGQALAVGLCIWFRSGIEKSATVRLGRKWPSELGVERDAARRGLRRLELAGLVSVSRRVGCAPLVTIISAPPLRKRVE